MVKISQSALVQQSGNDIYFIIEGPCDGYFTEKVSQARPIRIWITSTNWKLTFRNQFFVGAMITLQFEQ